MLTEAFVENHSFAVRLYVSKLMDDRAFYDRWYELMPKARRERSDRFRIEADRHRCIMAYAVLAASVRELIEDVRLPVDERIFRSAADGILDIDADAGGKPFFKDIPVCFNISHAGERVAVALSPAAVGCDVECKASNALQIAKRFFAPEEYAHLSKIDDADERDTEFTKLWTQKESIVKCCGEGIGRGFSDFSLVDEDGRRRNIIRLTGADRDYHIKEFGCESGYCYSVCSICGDIEEKMREVRIGNEQE